MAARSGYRSVTRVTICRARGHAAGKFVTRRPLSQCTHMSTLQTQAACTPIHQAWRDRAYID